MDFLFSYIRTWRSATGRRAGDDCREAAEMVMLDYEIVIATRNRADALAVSIPLFIAQSRPAKRIIVVDSSTDHAAIVRLCRALAARTAIPIEVVESDRASLVRQRNIGLDMVREAVVAFPDDDSLWFADTAAHLMTVYDRDAGGLIGGVTAVEVARSPLEDDSSIHQRKVKWMHIPNVVRMRNVIERQVFPQPFNMYGQQKIAELSIKAQAAGLKMTYVPTMGGFRMSFRTSVLQRHRFDETLGSRVGYSQHEDKDVCLRILKGGNLLAAADEARVFHNAHPGVRANGFQYGFCQILNYMYICRKVFDERDAAFAMVRRYCAYKGFLYRLRRTTPYHRDVYHGAIAALAQYDRIRKTAPVELAHVYGDICDRMLP